MISQRYIISPWRKSSHSGSVGQECVEVATLWRKSTHSGGEGQECVEVTALMDQGVALRDSKDASGPILPVAPSAWATLLASIKDGSLDLTP
ncbi:DUF397 domain-containing protein [Actinomadura decatromicini]|uniref:DUF397 domain-containing protein n=1 Tax=Actinomadura decatromicini TaxID=2604572 RepID=A0A5D3F6Q7_9ACTN|nr:DUF397 domain-containing protein [Actinomadura decatromicini]TYK43025.1 DUF397 domain-containing protein [Actinomadura decatromicini]